MAFRCHRLVLHVQSGKSRITLLNPSHSRAAIGLVHAANLTSAQSHDYNIQRAKPWPYQTSPYKPYCQFIDHTTKRFNDNTKIIVVDGNVASGKTEFAKKLAVEFDLYHMEDTVDSELYTTSNGFDIRELNEQLPYDMRTLDVETFLLKTAPAEMMNTIGRTQLLLYQSRFFKYVSALEHLLNTGQGVVIERGPWNDAVYAETLQRQGYMSIAALNYYNKTRDNTLCELWKPHLYIYLDGPVSEIQKRLKGRNPTGMKPGVLSDSYLQTIEDIHKKKMIPTLMKHSEVLTYDITDLPTMEMIVEDLERLNLDVNPNDDTELFKDWDCKREDDWNGFRSVIAAKWQWEGLFSAIHAPWDAPELMYSGDNYKQYINIVQNHPEVKYQSGYNPEKHSILFRL